MTNNEFQQQTTPIESKIMKSETPGYTYSNRNTYSVAAGYYVPHNYGNGMDYRLIDWPIPILIVDWLIDRLIDQMIVSNDRFIERLID